MSENKGIACPQGSLVVTQVDNREWEFEYPRLEWEIYESFHDAIDDWQMGDTVTAEETYRQLIDDYPEFIDAHHHLALLLGETGRGEEAFQIWQEVVALGLGCLPQEFEMGRDTLPWLMVYPFQGMGEALPRYFEQDTLAHLRALPVRTRIPFEEFADGLIKRTRLTWTSPDSDYATTSLRGSIEQMVIRILADFGAVEREHRAEPLGAGTIRKLAAFEITPFGVALLDAVALASA